MSGDDAAGRARRLYDEGAAQLEALWDGEAAMVRTPEHPQTHSPRATLAYAAVLLGSGAPDAITRAATAIRAVLDLQERHEDDAHRGNFRWLLEHETVHDLNGVEFMLDGLNAIMLEHGAALPADLQDEIRDAIALGLEEIDALDVHLSYTNIALSDICNSILGGELLGDEYLVERGARRLDEWFAFTNRSGAPHEYNSPTYLAVDIARMAMLAEHTADPDVALKARVAEELLWQHTAAHYHPALAQLAGPHCRSYFDGWTGAGGYLKLMLWVLLGDPNLRRATPYARRHREEGHTGVGGETRHAPPLAERWLREKRFPFLVQETADAARGLDLTTYMTASYALGTASRSYGVGDPPEQWEQPNGLLLHFRRDAPPGYGTLFTRYASDGHGLGPGSTDPGDEWNEEGVFVGAQHRSRAIVACGLRPRLRPVTSYRMSINMLGIAGARILAGLREVTAAATPRDLDAGEAVCIEAGDAYVGIVPLAPSDMAHGAPIELRVEGEKLALDLYNYRGPAKSFWEHRSQAGPFFKGNVRNAAVIEVAARADFPSLDAFARHIADATVADSLGSDYVREIAYASEGGSIALRYSLLDMSPVERRYDGEPYTAPMSRAGAIDGSGMQWVQSRESIIRLGGAKLLAGTPPKCLAADDDAGRYLFLNPSEEEAPLWLETPRTIIECDAFGFGRVDLDERDATVDVEAIGEIGPIRLRAEGNLRLRINAVDVTDRLTITDGWRQFSGL